jgi:hypothetical protein
MTTYNIHEMYENLNTLFSHVFVFQLLTIL